MTFNQKEFQQWCALYIEYFIRDQQQLAQAIQNTDPYTLQEILLKPEIEILKLLNTTKKKAKHYINAYCHLSNFQTKKSYGKPYMDQIYQAIEVSYQDIRYLLTSSGTHPIAQGIPEDQRFKQSKDIGNSSTLALTYHWQQIENSCQIDFRPTDALHYLTESHSHIKIGFSPFAGINEMSWKNAPDDLRGIKGEMPFWCEGAKNSDELWQHLESILLQALVEKVDILILPELVIPTALKNQISKWLRDNNAFEPVIRLLIAGSEHVFVDLDKHQYSNRCTVYNYCGDIEWIQEKRQPFKLDAEVSRKLFGVNKQTFEPTELSQIITIRNSQLGNLASPICLDFLDDPVWKNMPVNVFLVPVMSNNLNRFKDESKNFGKKQIASFICNSKGSTMPLVYSYCPSVNNPQPELKHDSFFIIELAIDMNYSYKL